MINQLTVGKTQLLEISTNQSRNVSKICQDDSQGKKPEHIKFKFKIMHTFESNHEILIFPTLRSKLI